MTVTAASSVPTRSRFRRPGLLLAAAGLLLTGATTLAGPAAAAPTAPATRAHATRAHAASVPVSSLAMTGTSTTVTVRRVYRTGQVRWINHVLDTRLVGLDGCQAERARASWNGRTYRTTVRTVCADGPARAQEALRRLVHDRPWYRTHTTEVGLVGFGLIVDLPEGNDRAVPAALAQLPSGPFTFTQGDDLSLNYVGVGVTQNQLDAAVTAFAAALGVPVSKVEVTPLAS